MCVGNRQAACTRFGRGGGKSIKSQCVDDPLDSTVTPGLIAARPVRNEFFFANIFWDVTNSLEVGFEVSHWETSYAKITPVDIDNQAMMYHTRVRLKF